MKVIVHLHRWGPTACANTFNFFERKQVVGSSAVVTDAQPLLAVLKNFFRTAQHAGNIGAHLHVVLATRLRSQHGVVADYIAYFELSEVKTRRQFSDHYIAQLTDFVMRIKKR